ncbi:MAG: TonB-dependent receptor domain-containing protein [Bacteroidia bacterium]
MKRKLFAVLLSLLSFSFCFGQGTIRGKITDNTGEALIGATVVLKANKSIGAMADLDGNFALKITDTTEQTIIVSYVSYKSQEAVVHPKGGEVVVKDFVLVSATTLDEVVITAKVNKANNYYMENMKMKSSSTMDYISQETMKKTGDVAVVNAIARVSGVTTSANTGTITVRGMGDRYIKTTLNGSRIPTLDPYSNSIRLDLFPSSLIDNVVLVKTASPDLPGDWAGAYVSVETKDYPDKLLVVVESQAGYNAQSTFKNVISSERSKTDWMGFDTGLRDHSHNVNGPSPIYNSAPTDYQTFVALGYGDYYNSIGVNGSTPWNSTYFNLGLVQMGLLQNSQLGDPNAIAAATAQFNNGPYRGNAFNSINANVAKEGQSFKDNWNTTTRKSPLNLTESFTIGNQINLFGRPLGFLVGFRYGNNMQYDPKSTSNRVQSNGAFESRITQEASTETNSWNALANIGYKYHPNHSISFMFMPNFLGANNVRYSIDNSDPAAQLYFTKTKFYEQRKQLVYQVKSEHYFTKPQLKVELNASYTKGRSSAPDFTDVTYMQNANSQYYQFGNSIGNGLRRYFRYLSDDLFDSRISAELPIGDAAIAGPRKIKFGGSYMQSKQKRDFYEYIILQDFSSTSTDLNQVLSLNNFGFNNGTIPISYQEYGSPVNHTFGYSTVKAAYLMTDYSIVKRLRLSGGLRVEQANIFTDVFKYDSLHYEKNDPRRNYKVGAMANPGSLNNLAYLPSANLIFIVKDDDAAPINVRLNYSQTTARPSIRELSEVAVYDYFYRVQIAGRSDLKPVQAKNYDIRFEWYFKNRDNFSVSGFYKDIKNNIELVSGAPYTYQNCDKSNVKGIELDGKKSITKYFDLMANITLVRSRTEFIQQQVSRAGGIPVYRDAYFVSRPMFGQANYVINGILSFNAPEKMGLNATLSYNRQGQRLAIASSLPVSEVPDVYEMPRDQVDCKITKKLGKYFSVSLTARDLLNSPVRRAYLYPNGKVVDYDKFRYGTYYVFGVTYKIQ